MKSIVESIKSSNGSQIDEAVKQNWEVADSISSVSTIGGFSVQRKPYMCIISHANRIVFLTIDEIESSFEDFELEDEFVYVKKLKVGESFSSDGENIYVRLF